MHFYEWFWDIRALRIMGKCISRHLFRYGGSKAHVHPCSLRSSLFRFLSGKRESREGTGTAGTKKLGAFLSSLPLPPFQTSRDFPSAVAFYRYAGYHPCGFARLSFCFGRVHLLSTVTFNNLYTLSFQTTKDFKR